MSEHYIPLPAGLSVDLMVGPEDIRTTSVSRQNSGRISFLQTDPPLKAEWIGHTLLMTFVSDRNSSRRGYKIKVLGMSDDTADAGPFLIEAELMDAIEKYDLRKYPRFNPKLFDRLEIFLGDASLDLTDVSSGGARGTCRSKGLTNIHKGKLVMLDVKLGTISYRVKAEIMRIRHSGPQDHFYEIAIAFVEWDKNFTRAQQS